MSGQYFDPSPAAASRPGSVALMVEGHPLTLATDRGVFGRHEVDVGTRLLLDTVPPPPASGNLLDLGCGYGPIAVTVGWRAPGATVWAVDVNERARSLTATNAEAAGLTNVRVAAPDDVPDDVRFAAIWSNPPVRVGKAQMHEILDRWLGRLEDDGRAWLVVQKHLGADSLARWLDEGGHATRRLRSKRSFRVLEVGPGPR